MKKHLLQREKLVGEQWFSGHKNWIHISTCILCQPQASFPSYILILDHHIALYLPTCGQGTDYLNQIIELRIVVGNLSVIYPDSLFFIPGDSNANPNNTSRAKIFSDFCADLNLINIPTQHKIYHHFLREGLLDSTIDVILQSETAPYTDEILKIICQTRFPKIDSHHDSILSSVSLPYQPVKPKEILLTNAAKKDHERHKVYWNEINI